MRTLLAVTAMMLSCGSLLKAGPLDRRQVSADAKWLAHIDFDAVNSAKVARAVRDEWLRHDSVKQSIQKVRETVGTDLRQDLLSITFYGNRFARFSGVVVLQAKVDRQRLLGYLKRMPDYQTGSYGSYELHAWTQDKGKRSQHTLTGCLHRPTVMVFGRDAGEVKAALDVLDGKAPSLAGSDSLLAAEAPAGTIFQARAASLADAEIPLKSPIVRQTDFLSILIGEHGGEAFAQASLVAKSAEAAQQVRAVVDGFLAIARLQHAENEDTMKLLEAIRATATGQTVTIQWRGPADDILKLIREAWTNQPKPKQAD